MSRKSRPTAVALATVLGAAVIAAPAAAQSPPNLDPGQFSGAADAVVVDVDVVDTGDFGDGLVLVDGQLAPSGAAADRQQGLSFRDESDLASFAFGTDIAGALLGELSTDSILVEAVQTAPPDNEERTEETLIEVPADPLLTARVASADAWARDVANFPCIFDNPLAEGGAEIADAILGPNAIDDGAHFLHLGDVVASLSSIVLTEVDGQSTLGVSSVAQSDVARLDLFGGQDADGATIAIASPATLTATATGTPGTATVTYNAPIVTVNGEGLTADEPVDVPIGDPSMGFIARIQLGQFTQDVAADGTAASGEATLIEITLLQSTAEGSAFTLANIAVGELATQATAPAGGVDCVGDAGQQLINVSKDGPEFVQPGDSFDYVIEVVNDQDCTLTDLEAVDVVDGPDGTAITATDPEAQIDGLTATWTDLPDLAPGESLTLTVTVQVPEDAQPGDRLSDEVTVTGLCDGDDASGTDTLDGPEIVFVLPRDEGPDDDQLPVTGGGLAGLGLLGVLAAAALSRRF